MNYYTTILFLVLLIVGCNTAQQQTSTAQKNPAADGFKVAQSDQAAISIADEVMEAMGGRKAWDDTRFISWNFFGARTLFWDKQTGNVRINNHRDKNTIYLNIFDSTKGVVLDSMGNKIEDTALRAEFLKKGKGMWINDAYWLVMPFKLKDSGVTLKHLGAGKTEAGLSADILELTFENVGNTPNNKYLVYVDQQEKLVRQWDFFTNTTDTERRFFSPWDDYQQHGDILLSGNRGQRSLTEIQVLDTLPEDLKTAPLFGKS